MAKASLRFKRVAEAFDVAARASVTSTDQQSSPVPESFTDLSELVNSFINGEEVNNNNNNGECIVDEISDENECGDYWERINNLLREYLEYDDDDHVKLKIHAEVESACRVMDIDTSSPEFKRRLMIILRERGFDAGLCRSKWSKTAQLLPGNYEYIDVNIGENRYIVEVLIAGEFKLARSTEHYSTLLKTLPTIYVGKIELLQHVVRLMSRAIKRCMNKYEMHVPPWRRCAYMQAKWFGLNYKRAINFEILDKKGSDSDEKSEKKRAVVGFAPLMGVANCSYDFCRKACGGKVGNLAMAMNMGMG